MTSSGENLQRLRRKEGKPMDKRRDGQAMVEYALILVLIAVVVIAVLLVLGGEIKTIFNSIAGALHSS